MTSSRPLTALAEARAALLALLSPVAPRDMACAEAVGAVAAETPGLSHPAPSRAIALRAGYAVSSQDISGASSFSPAFLAAAPKRVTIGDALPDGCDSVLDAAAVDVAGPTPLAYAETYPGENARRTGEDFAAGAFIVPGGRKVTARDALAAAGAGLTHVQVRTPRVAIPGEGPVARYVEHVALSEGAAIVALAEAPHLIVCIGDAPSSASWRARGLALEPGRDCGVGHIDATPVVFLPAAPDQAFAGALLLLRPALDRLTGRLRPAPRTLPLSAKIASRVGLAELVLLQEGQGVFTPLAVGDAPLHALCAATHVALIAAESEGHVSGELCAAVPLDD